eukprot:TRINITY_DN27201_c0_g1_i1.p1 TRINITY_DN27201_c0_g1~~TRINITY_DN27201_c0_g1_i1.p1  ORF type:complete len:308 (+),score=100.79 TRINITY_DN27201_c0_g1_i1:49-972(+)
MADDCAGLDDHDGNMGAPPGWLTQASGAIRGSMVGVARVFTRPAQMKVLVWLAKRKWKEARAGGGAPKEVGKNTLRLHALPAIMSECLIGTVMYDTYARAYEEIQKRELPAWVRKGDGYPEIYAAGAIAGATSALLSTPHNNIVTSHADTWKAFRRAIKYGDLTVLGPKGVFKGLRFAMVRDSITTGTMFTCVTFVKRQLPPAPKDNVYLDVLRSFFAGGLGGMAGTAVALPFTRAHAWSTQYAGSHYFSLVRKIASREGGSLLKYMLAGIPPLAFAAFLPNAFGMAALHVSMEMNRKLEEVDASAA